MHHPPSSKVNTNIGLSLRCQLLKRRHESQTAQNFPHARSVAEVAPTGVEGRAQHRPVEYSGPGETFVRHIANATYGGQVERPTTQAAQQAADNTAGSTWSRDAVWRPCGSGFVVDHSELLFFVCFLGYVRNVGLCSMSLTA